MKNLLKKQLIQGTLILTGASFLTKFIGFFYRIFLSNTIGAEGMGIYQLIFPVYGLCFSITAAGIQTALARLIASQLACQKRHHGLNCLLSGLLLSVLLSLILSILLYQTAQPVSTYFLKEPRCTNLLRILSFSLPLGTIHACINGYFLAEKRAKIPAALQLTEQLTRVLSSIILYWYFVHKNVTITPVLAVCGMLISECVASTCSVILLFRELHNYHHSFALPAKFVLYTREIGKLATPLSLNRLLLSILHSVEAMLIPSALQSFGCTTSKALSLFGTLNGMALPMILFPTALTTSASTILLPTVAEKQASGNLNTIFTLVKKSTLFALTLGSACSLIFYFWGPVFGELIFGSPLAGHYLRTLAFICPFLYLDSTLSGILHGLGKTMHSFLINLCGLSLRIGFVLFMIPRQGISGIIYGLLTSELLCALLSFFTILRTIQKDSGRQTT